MAAAALTGRQQSLSSSFKGLQVSLGPDKQSAARLERLQRVRACRWQTNASPGTHLAAEAAIRERSAPPRLVARGSPVDGPRQTGVGR